MKRVIPENFRRLWAAEDDLIGWAEGIIAASEELHDHLDLVEIYMDGVDAMRQLIPDGDRHLAIGGLFLRTWDALGHSVRAALSGNYTGSAMYSRDLLETHFLIDYLMEETGRPEAWLHADAATIRKDFHPATVRKALDERDGYQERNRKRRYDELSVLGSHPTPTAFNLKRDGARMINAGPFPHEKLLQACVQEAARAAIVLGSDLLSYIHREIPNGRSFTTRLALALQRTEQKYLSPRYAAQTATQAHQTKSAPDET
jgi:hypothetical protein